MKKVKKFWGTSISITLSLLGSIFFFILPEIFPENIMLREAICMITIVSIFYSFVSVILRNIADENNKEHQKILQSITPLSSGLSSKYFFPASEYPNNEFNRIINEELCRTKSYFYFSNKAFYHTNRLLALFHKVQRNSIFTVILPDLYEDEIFEAIADNLIEKARIIGNEISKEKEFYVRLAREDTFKSIYYVTKLKEHFKNVNKIILYLHREIPFIRFELSDTLLALSFLPMIKEGYYPPSMIYSKNSLYWETFSAYVQQIINRSKQCGNEETIKYLEKVYTKYNFGKQKNSNEESFNSYISCLDNEFNTLKEKAQAGGLV